MAVAPHPNPHDSDALKRFVRQVDHALAEDSGEGRRRGRQFLRRSSALHHRRAKAMVQLDELQDSEAEE